MSYLESIHLPVRRTASMSTLLTLLWSMALGICAWPAREAVAQDLQVTVLQSPVSGCTLSNQEVIRFVIYNHGPTLAGGSVFSVNYRINGGPLQEEGLMIGNPLRANSILTYTMMARPDLSAPGDYELDVGVVLPADPNPFNNTLSGMVRHVEMPVPGTVMPVIPVADSGELLLSGEWGDVTSWQQSTDGHRWRTLANTTSMQFYDRLAEPTQFRAVVARPPCAEVMSTPATVFPVHLFRGDFE
ncbi:MAG: hypothetical protein IPK97_02265 [Ahniella sp.]|nr:hypothetical protein [Ahniella sp.]